ncbi:hypothetical protein AB0J63_49625 [Streptosporangium canum]|uniref:hypothetical protein n=1 Tax=Streptosporangium canum TaxID=324952 RepID=UPI0034166CCE
MKPGSPMAPSPASRKRAVILLWRAVVISLERQGPAAEIHDRLPLRLVMAAASGPCACRTGSVRTLG